MTSSSKWILGAVLAVLAVGGVALFFALQQPADNLGGQFYQQNAKASDEVQLLTASSGTIGGEITRGERLSYWQNKTGATVYVHTSPMGYAAGTASTSLRIYQFATTTPPAIIAARYAYTSFTETLNGANTFLQNWLVPTSTTATTTNSLMALKENRGTGVIAVPNNGYLVVLLQNASGISNAPNAACTGATCEPATSTARGVNTFFWKAYYVR